MPYIPLCCNVEALTPSKFPYTLQGTKSPKIVLSPVEIIIHHHIYIRNTARDDEQPLS
jgi:hypothetical protein